MEINRCNKETQTDNDKSKCNLFEIMHLKKISDVHMNNNANTITKEFSQDSILNSKKKIIFRRKIITNIF